MKPGTPLSHLVALDIFFLPSQVRHYPVLEASPAVNVDRDVNPFFSSANTYAGVISQ